MAADSSNQNRTLPATPRKIERARSEGQIARSHDLGHFFALGAGVALLAAFAPDLTRWLAQSLGEALRFDLRSTGDPGQMSERLAAVTRLLMMVVLPVGGIAMALALAAGLASGGWNFTMKPLAPQFSKLNPISGIARLFSLAHIAE